MANNIDALIANFPGTLQENALNYAKQQLAQQSYAQNALKLQEQVQGRNALQGIYSDQSKWDPATGLPRPSAMGPLMTASPQQGLDFLEVGAKLNEEHQRSMMLNLHTKEYWTGIFSQKVVQPLLAHDQSLAPGTSPEERERSNNAYREELIKGAIAETGAPPDVADSWHNIPFDQSRIPIWAAQDVQWQAHQDALAKSWKPKTDPANGQEYYESDMRPGLRFKPDMKTPYEFSGLGKPTEKPGGYFHATWLDADKKPQSTSFTRDAFGRTFDPSGAPIEIPANADVVPARAAGAGGAGLSPSKPYQILNKDGEVVREGMAREAHDKTGFVDSTTGEPVTVDTKAGESLRETTPGAASGGRAGAQVIRQQIAGKEVLSDLQNVVRLPYGTTGGLFGTYQAGTSLWGALQGDVVRKFTPQAVRLMQGSLANMTTELSFLMSPVYAGKYRAEQTEKLLPQAGDTVGTVMYNLARLAQTADNAIEAMGKSSIVNKAQKQYGEQLRSAIKTAIPWTPAQAQDFALNGRRGETFGAFVARTGPSEATPKGSAGAAAKPPAMESHPVPEHLRDAPEDKGFTDANKNSPTFGQSFMRRGDRMVPAKQMPNGLWVPLETPTGSGGPPPTNALAPASRTNAAGQKMIRDKFGNWEVAPGQGDQ